MSLNYGTDAELELVLRVEWRERVERAQKIEKEQLERERPERERRARLERERLDQERALREREEQARLKWLATPEGQKHLRREDILVKGVVVFQVLLVGFMVAAVINAFFPFTK